jgi:hypothetical protein
MSQLKPKGFVCRSAEWNPCDIDEVCDGVSKYCPGDIFEPAGTSCGDSDQNECSDPDTCDGHGICLSNHKKADGDSCGNPEDDCNKGSSCMNGVCVFGGYKDESTPCGTTEGSCDLPDHCDGNGYCIDLVAANGYICRPAAPGGCDVAEACDGASKICPVDVFKPSGTFCGKTGAELGACEIQDKCDDKGTCKDLGQEPSEYTFKCGTHNYFCGDDVIDERCQDGATTSGPATAAQCAFLINKVNDPAVNIFGVKCPNGRAVSHYVRYDCKGMHGLKYEFGSCSVAGYTEETCPAQYVVQKELRCDRRRNLRKESMFSFWS